VRKDPFIRSEGEAGWSDGKGDQAAGGGDINAGCSVRWGGETESEWGVKRGECGAVSRRGGDIRAVRVHARGCAIGCLRKKKLGGAHAVVRGEGGGTLGLGEGGSPREEEGEWAGGRSHGPGGKRKEAGPKSLLRLRSKGVKEN
jgi:hypothetical protein